MKQVMKITSMQSLHPILLSLSKLTEELGFSQVEKSKLMTAVSEMATNTLKYADGGVVEFQEVEREGKKGIEASIVDEGPGIPDLDQAFQDSYSTHGSLGLGLPGAKRMVDEFDIDTQVGKGTKIRLVVWKK